MLMNEADFEQENAEEEGDPEEEEEPEEEDDEKEDPNLESAAGNMLNVGSVLIREEHIADSFLLQRLNHQESYWLEVTDRIPGKTVKVATQWAPFFASLLLSPKNYKWARMFAESEAWAIFSSSLKTSLIKILDNIQLNHSSAQKLGQMLGLGQFLLIVILVRRTIKLLTLI